MVKENADIIISLYLDLRRRKKREGRLALSHLVLLLR